MTNDSDTLVTAATATAVAMIAQQTAGKAVRDALFLSQFEMAALPTILAVSAVLTIGVVLLVGPLIRRVGPGRVIPNAFVVSGILLLFEYALLQLAPRLAAVVVYVHMASFGAVLISGFWSMVSEAFDPRTARKRMARIAGGATLGGLCGGLLAERLAAWFGVDAVLPLLAALHLYCSWQIRALRDVPRPLSSSTPLDTQDGGRGGSAVRILFGSPYLLGVASMLLLGTVGAALIDYVFKAQAKGFYSTDAEGMLRFFALYYAGTGLITFAVQAGLGRRVLVHLGLTGAVASNPLAVLMGSVGALLAPGLVSATVARSAEAVARSSLFRSGYELLFAPVPRSDRRATKTLIDVGFDRLGDALGAGIAALVLGIAGAWANQTLLVLAAGLSALGLLLARRLKWGYRKALKISLLTQAERLQLAEPEDEATRAAMMETMGTIDVTRLVELSKARRAAEASAGPESGRPLPAPPRPAYRDPDLRRLEALRSGDIDRVHHALRSEPIDRQVAEQAIGLLGWDPVRSVAQEVLSGFGPHIVGLLRDHLTDPDETFVIRRRVPSVLATVERAEAAHALLAGLDDERFEVRFRCGRGLVRLQSRCDGLLEGAPFAAQLTARILAEINVSRRVWESRDLLDGVDETGPQFVDAMLRARTNRSLEHVFTLLSLFQPARPLIVAFRGLHTGDAHLRGTALEYLDVSLPTPIRDAIWPLLDEGATHGGTGRPRGNALQALMNSNVSIELRLSELSEPADEGDA